VAAITLGAAALRLTALGKVSPDPFYDAAVRSMGLSWHNFFFGAFEPGGSVSIDKPPVDLWLQVISVKLFGFSSTTLKLPEVFAGIVSVPLLYAAVRRMWDAPQRHDGRGDDGVDRARAAVHRAGRGER
jgi:4-amino-4-deoxy-L-arabinose transferase-like glycosyltransferase